MTIDMVNSPPHYTAHPSGVECIQITEHMNFNLGNAVKYLWRVGLKGDNAIEDLSKAAFYVAREIARLGGDAKTDSSDATATCTKSPDGWTYEHFGKVRDISVTSEWGHEQEFAVDLVSTTASSATHSIKFTADSDNPGVADLWLGKPERGACATEARTVFKVGDRVRVTGTSGGHDAPVGTIARIKHGPDHAGDCKIEYPDDWDYVQADMLEPATEPKVGDRLTITGRNGHVFPVGAPVKVVRLGGWGSPGDADRLLCEDSGGLWQAPLVSDTNW